MKIPKLDRLLLLAVGVLVAFIGVFSRFSFVADSSLAIIDQHPIDIESLTGEYDATENVGNFLGQMFETHPVAKQESNQEATIDLATIESMANIEIPQVLGDEDSAKRIYVDLANQRVYAFQGDKLIYNFLISSGKWGRTPTGTFKIWGKFRYTKMSGGSRALNTYYYLPNVPYVMFFANSEIAAARGFSLHGTYWHDNFGHPMSHGCVNMKTEDAELLYYWSTPTVQDKNYTRATQEDPGTEIIIYGEAPSS